MLYIPPSTIPVFVGSRQSAPLQQRCGSVILKEALHLGYEPEYMLAQNSEYSPEC